MRGKIYKIVHSQSNAVYVGSTFATLRERFRMHKKSIKYGNYCVISLLMKEYGSDQFKIILIKEYEVCDRKHLCALEQLWINKLKCINKQCAFQIISHKEQMKQWYLKNRERVLTQQKQYQEDNKEKIKQYQNKKIRCDICNSSFTNSNKAKHLKSTKHQSRLEAL